MIPLAFAVLPSFSWVLRKKKKVLFSSIIANFNTPSSMFLMFQVWRGLCSWTSTSNTGPTSGTSFKNFPGFLQGQLLASPERCSQSTGRLFIYKKLKAFCCKMPCLLRWKKFKTASAETAILSKRAPSNPTVSQSCGAQSQRHRCVMCYKVTVNVKRLLRHTVVSEERRCSVWSGWRWRLICFPHASPPSVQQWRVLQTSDCTTAAAGLKITSVALIISSKWVLARHSDPQGATQLWKYLYLFICWRHNRKLFLSLFYFMTYLKVCYSLIMEMTKNT